MNLKNISVFILLLSYSLTGQAQKIENKLGETPNFEFYSNYWVNMHHFLYEKASNGQVRKLQRDGYTFSWKEEALALQKLSKKEQVVFNQAVAYYQKHLIDKNLLFKLTPLTVQLSKASKKVKNDSLILPELATTLNAFSKVYKKKLWPIHHAKNKEIINKHIALTQKGTEQVVGKMEELSGYSWPNEKVRIDLTAYANWAGGYTTSYPRDNVFISSIDPTMQTTAFIELVYHEGTHLLFGFHSPIRKVIYNEAQKHGLKTRDIWHSIQFYVCGKAAKDFLKKEGMEHIPIMDDKRIYLRFKTPLFVRVLDQYYNGTIDMKTMVQQILPVFLKEQKK